MSYRTAQSNCEFSLANIAAYIDGELCDGQSEKMDEHFADCFACRIELNEQKQFLCGLNLSLKATDEIELPKNFTKLIVANAESSVGGLRQPRERYNALFVSVALLIFGLFALGPDAEVVLTGAASFIERVAAVAVVIGRAVYSFFFGLAIIVRTVLGYLGSDAGALLIFPTLVAAFLLFVSRKSLSIRRA